MAAKNPFQHILVAAEQEDQRYSDADDRGRKNPFEIFDLVALCIKEQVSASLAAVKQAVKQPFQKLVDTFFPTAAILENLRNPKLMQQMQYALVNSSRSANRSMGKLAY